MAKSSPEPKTILIVDDEMNMRIFIKTLFETSGFQTLTARDGKEGMQKVDQHQPHLIILDVMMPGEGGIAMYQNLKTDPRYAAIPVIMLSGVGFKTFGHFLTMLKSRIKKSIPEPDHYLEKPVEPSQLLKIAESLL
jgi:CheY-like chemotaxis protein